MKNTLFILIIIVISVFFLSSCVRDKAETIVKERIVNVPPESFLNVNIQPRGSIYFVSFPAKNRIGYVQFTVRDYEPEKPNKLKFHSSILAIQGDIDKVCEFNNLPQEELLPLIHDKITAYHKIGVSRVKGINSMPFIVFQYNEEVVLYYVAHLPQEEIESFVTSNKLHILNKTWLYEKHEGDILY